MTNDQLNNEAADDLSLAEAELMGAFQEDALSLEDAAASTSDEALSPNEVQAAISLANHVQG